MRTFKSCLFAVVVLTTAFPRLHAQSANGRFGPGIVLTKVGKELWIDAVTPNSPAASAGLHVGDRVWSIDDIPVSLMTDVAANAALVGARGTPVRITTMGTELKTFTLRRASSTNSTSAAPVPEAPIARVSSTAPVATIQSRPAQSRISFVRWVDPRERSFSIDVPRGWTVTGGLNWVGPLEPMMAVEARSPDGRLQIFIGDPQLTTRQNPSFGAREGTVFRSGTGDPVTYQKYLSGSGFAKFEVADRRCQNPTWLSASDDPQTAQKMVAAIQPQAASLNLTTTASAGDIGFMCGTQQGYASAVTVAVSQGRQNAWFIASLGVFLSADPMRSMETRYAMEHMLATLEVDPGWQKAADERAAASTAGALLAQNARFEAQQAAYRSSSNTLSRMNHPMEDVGTRSSSSPRSMTRDTDRMCDAIGRCQTVTNDGRPVFIDHSGRVAHGTSSGSPPDNSGAWSPMFHQ